MARQLDEVRALVRRDGVVARRDHPELVGALGRLTRTGELVPVLPGVYTSPGARDRREARLAALARWAPDAVLVERTAAQLTFWPGLPGATIECAVAWDREPRPGFSFSRRRVPAELVVHRRGLRMTSPSLTCLDLCARHGGDGIDQALRARAVTLRTMRDALDLTGWRPGNVDRRALLLDSRDEPWSAAERLCHRLLRSGRFTGWTANLPVTVDGDRYFLDVAFPRLRLVLEIDGRLHEDDPDLFESDRWRQNALVLDGWHVLRFTWRMLLDHPDRVVEDVRRAISAIRSGRPAPARRATPDDDA